MSKTQEYAHLVFGTKRREATINPEHRRDLYKFLYYLLKENGCYVYRINGMTDHVHILYDKSPTIATSDLVCIIKGTSSRWMKQSGLFPRFKGWAKEYFSASKGRSQLEGVISYIANQENHHRDKNFYEELREMYVEEGFEWNDNDFQ